MELHSLHSHPARTQSSFPKMEMDSVDCIEARENKNKQNTGKQRLRHGLASLV